MKLYNKISLINLLIFGSIIFLSVFLFYVSSRYILIDEQRKDLTDLAIHYLKPMPGKNTASGLRGMKQGLIDMVYVVKYKSNGEVQVLQDPYGIGEIFEIGIFEIDEFEFIGIEVIENSGKYLFVKEVTSVIRSLHSMANGFGFLSVILVAIAGFFATVSARYSLKPLIGLVKGIEVINTSKLKTRFELSKNNDEVDALKGSLNRMLSKLDDGFELQKRFNSDVSHELRTPVTSIKGYALLLKKWGIENKEVVSESLDAIIATSSEMESLIEQLLILGKVEEIDLTRQPIDSIVFIKNIKDRTVRKFPKRNFNWIKKDFVESFNCSNEYLTFMIDIFIDNAVKYSSDEAEIDMIFEGDRIIVKDRGIGISKLELEKIFNRFYKIDSSRTTRPNTKSYGIGLSIAQTLAEKLNIKIDISSELEKGTEISIYLS